MKKLLTAAVAALAMVPLAAPAMADQHGRGPDRGHDRGRDHGWHGDRGPGRGPGDNGWQPRRGERFDRGRAPNYQVIDYHRYRGLRAPPRGYHWVRSGNDAVLVALSTGLIASVIAGAIR